MSKQPSLYQRIVEDFQVQGKLEAVGEEGVQSINQPKYLTNSISIKPNLFAYPFLYYQLYYF